MFRIWEVVDTAPTLYVLGVAGLVYLLGNALRTRLPILTSWQESVGAATFLLLSLRRLVWNPPTEGPEVMLVLLRSAAFGLISFGIAGTIGIVWVTVLASLKRIKWNVQATWNRWRDERNRKRAKDLASVPAPRPDPGELRRERELELQWESEQERQRQDQQRRKDLRLRTELMMEFAIDRDRRRKLDGLLETYADESLPVDEYEERLATIEQAITQHSPRRAKRFQSMQEINDEFDRQLQDLEHSPQPEIEKEEIRSMIRMERHTAIQRMFQQ